MLVWLPVSRGLIGAVFDGAEYLEYPDIYAGVTAEDVEQFIRENVKEEQAFLSVITPKREEE